MDSTPPLSVDVTDPKNSHTRSPRLISCPQSDLFTNLNGVNWVLYSNSINIYFLWLNLSVYNDGTRVMLRIHLTVTVSQLSLLLTIMIVVIVSQLTFLLAPPRQRTACPWKGFPDQNLKNSPSQICFEFCFLNISPPSLTLCEPSLVRGWWRWSWGWGYRPPAWSSTRSFRSKTSLSERSPPSQSGPTRLPPKTKVLLIHS